MGEVVTFPRRPTRAVVIMRQVGTMTDGSHHNFVVTEMLRGRAPPRARLYGCTSLREAREGARQLAATLGLPIDDQSATSTDSADTPPPVAA